MSDPIKSLQAENVTGIWENNNAPGLNPAFIIRVPSLSAPVCRRMPAESPSSSLKKLPGQGDFHLACSILLSYGQHGDVSDRRVATTSFSFSDVVQSLHAVTSSLSTNACGATAHWQETLALGTTMSAGQYPDSIA